MLLACALLLAGCGNEQSPLSPRSHPAREIANLWWVMLAIAGAVFLGTVAFIAIAVARRRTRGLPFFGSNERLETGLVVFFGIAVPVVVLISLFGVTDLGLMKDTQAPKAGSTRLTVNVIGHQWFWEVRYPGTAAVTANELHIPTGTRVQVVGTTADVIHSFWVPRLNRKIDLVPGRANRVLLYADKPGVYRGQCSEYCGLQHAHMGLYVFADPPGRFQAWLRNMASPARAPATGDQKLGRQLFQANQCASCHTIRGTPARGRIGPDLTHLQSRTTIAGLALPNRPADLARWIAAPQLVKPGNRMPGLNLTSADFQRILAYLETLR